MVFIQIPHFEGMFFGDYTPSNKVQTVISILSDSTSPEYALILDSYTKVLTKDSSIFTPSNSVMVDRYAAFYTSNKAKIDTLKNPELWVL